MTEPRSRSADAAAPQRGCHAIVSYSRARALRSHDLGFARAAAIDVEPVSTSP
jgi:hypothetical protein